MTPPARQILIAHTPGSKPTTTIRSTVLQSSIASLRQRGHFARWLTLVDPSHRETIVESLAPSWMPIEVAMAHYAACEALELPSSEQVAMGEAVGDRIQGSFLTTLMKSARAAGYNPLVLLGQFDRLYSRLFQGGSVQLTQTGPKDAEIEVRGLQTTRFPYFRVAFTGVVRAGIVFSGVRVGYVKQGNYSTASDTLVMHASWV
jgi:hypothetical protein